VSVHQGSVSSLTNEFICDPEIRRVDGSVHHHHHHHVLACAGFMVFFCHRGSLRHVLCRPDGDQSHSIYIVGDLEVRVDRDDDVNTTKQLQELLDV